MRESAKANLLVEVLDYTTRWPINSVTTWNLRQQRNIEERSMKKTFKIFKRLTLYTVL